jgi:hypothetical protein
MATRQQIIDEIWSGGGFPAAGATSVETGVASPLNSQSANLASVDLLTIEMRDNANNLIETNTPTVWRPTTANSKLAIYATGHTAAFNLGGHDDMIRALTTEGYVVIGVHMPFASTTNGGVSVGNHNALPARTASLNYLRFFVEPAIRAMNEIDASSFDAVHMTGLSGGGWQCPLLAAIDPRVQIAVGVAGSLPLSVTESSRDWEQFLPGLNSELGVDYPELYDLACSDGRKHYQVINTRDSCCFRATQYDAKPYRWQVKSRNARGFNVFFDSTHTGHVISAAGRAKILELFDQ